MATAHFTTPVPATGKFIHYDRETRDYVCYLDGEYIGSARTHGDGETLINEVVHDRLIHGIVDVEHIGIGVAYDGDEGVTSLAIGNTEVCVNDDQTVSIFAAGNMLRFRTPQELREFRALTRIFDHPQVRALATN